MIQMTYKKKNGDIIRRTISTYSPYREGDINSYGWTVESIKHLYNGKWYSKHEYDRLVDDAIARDRRKMKIKRQINTLYVNLGYLIEMMIIIRVFGMLSKSVM